MCSSNNEWFLIFCFKNNNRFWGKMPFNIVLSTHKFITSLISPSCIKRSPRCLCTRIWVFRIYYEFFFCWSPNLDLFSICHCLQEASLPKFEIKSSLSYTGQSVPRLRFQTESQYVQSQMNIRRSCRAFKFT